MTTCGTCRYGHDDNPEMGRDSLIIVECRRYPPSLATEADRDGEFPCTQESDWCGEWAAKPEAAKEAKP